MLAYLEEFTDHFGLREHIRFGSPVTSARLSDDGGWEVRVGDGVPERFRSILVATGYDSVPLYPELPGRFDGLQLHAHVYRTPEPFRGVDVVVIGLGCSATELACEIALSTECDDRRAFGELGVAQADWAGPVVLV